MKAAIVGYGDLGRYIKNVLVEDNGYSEDDLVFFDDDHSRKGNLNSYPFYQFEDNLFDEFEFYVCLGYLHQELRLSIIDKLLALGRKVPSYIDTSAYLHSTVTLGHGAFIYPGCNIDRGTSIGTGSWIANSSVISHDCSIGKGCWFGQTVVLSGSVVVKNHTFIGAGSTVSNDVRIGSDVVIGLASSVSRNIDNGVSAIGNPLKILDSPIKLI